VIQIQAISNAAESITKTIYKKKAQRNITLPQLDQAGDAFIKAQWPEA